MDDGGGLARLGWACGMRREARPAMGVASRRLERPAESADRQAGLLRTQPARPQPPCRRSPDSEASPAAGPGQARQPPAGPPWLVLDLTGAAFGPA
jgi:hypothetical protein